MSLHASMSPEAAAKLAAQKRNSTISSIIIALLLCTLIAIILWIISLTPLFKNNEETVSYAASSDSDTEITKPEMTDQVAKKPSAPSSSMARVIASTTPSPTAVPVPEITVTEPSLDFGDGDDFGDGWGSGEGTGSGGGGVSFFKQSVKAERIAYVIDYSASMKGKKFELMKKELAKSVSKLPDNVEYQLIFFAGPAWVAGDKVQQIKGPDRDFVVTSKGKDYDWKTTGGSATKYRPKIKSKMQQVGWIKSGEGKRKQSLKLIQNTPMVFGTVWEYPLEMALKMEPQPDVIFFMTDGTAGSDTGSTARKIGAEASRDGVIINCVALMEPKAKDAMGEISKRTGGVFTEVQANGKIIQHDVK